MYTNLKKKGFPLVICSPNGSFSLIAFSLPDGSLFYLSTVIPPVWLSATTGKSSSLPPSTSLLHLSPLFLIPSLSSLCLCDASAQRQSPPEISGRRPQSHLLCISSPLSLLLSYPPKPDPLSLLLVFPKFLVPKFQSQNPSIPASDLPCCPPPPFVFVQVHPRDRMIPPYWFRGGCV